MKVEPFFVGTFKKGETLDLGEKGNLFNFKLTEGEFPKSFTAFVFVVEKDWLRNSDFLDALSAVCYAISLALVAVAGTMLIVGAAGGPASGSLIVGLLAASIILGITNSAIRVMRDDVSSTAVDVLTLEAPPPPGLAFARTVSFTVGEYKGQYSAEIRWVTA